MIFRCDKDIAPTATGRISNDVVVVNLSACGAETSVLLSEFMGGAPKNGEKKEGHSKGSEGGHK